MTDRVLLGNAYTIAFTIRNDLGVPTNAATITLTIHKPDGSTETHPISDLTHPSTGVYEYDYLSPAAGRVLWDEISTAPNTAVQGWFDVYTVGADITYVTVGELRDVLAGTGNLAGTAATLSDDDLTDAINQAQAEVDGRLADRYDTPFTDPAQVVVAITRDIAAYLATLTYRRGDPIQTTEAVQLRYNRAQTMLGQVASGALLLAQPTGTSGDIGGKDPAAVANRYEGDLFQMGDFGLGPALSPRHLGSQPSTSW